jgi:hypothetical protein
VDLKTLIHPKEALQQALFVKFADVSAKGNVTVETICGAAINLLVTVVHRMNIKQGDAEIRWDDIFGQGKELLKARYKK